MVVIPYLVQLGDTHISTKTSMFTIVSKDTQKYTKDGNHTINSNITNLLLIVKILK